MQSISQSLTGDETINAEQAIELLEQTLAEEYGVGPEPETDEGDSLSELDAPQVTRLRRVITFLRTIAPTIIALEPFLTDRGLRMGVVFFLC